MIKKKTPFLVSFFIVILLVKITITGNFWWILTNMEKLWLINIVILVKIVSGISKNG